MKEVLAGAGLTEAYSFAFVSKEELGQYDIELDDAIKLKNPLSMDQEYLRPSLVPSMLTAVEQNQRRFASAQLFEVAPVYLPKKGDRPDEPLELVIAHYGKDGAELFGEAKGSLERMLRELGLSEWSYERDVDDARFHAGRSASIRVDSETVGVIGQVSPTTAKAFGIDVSVVIATVQVQKLLEKFSVTKSFTPLAQFPAVKRDLAFVVDERVEYVSIVEKLKSDSELVESIELFDVYRGKGVDEGKKSIALHMSFQASDRTLEAKEVDHELEEMRTVLQKDFDAIMRS